MTNDTLNWDILNRQMYKFCSGDIDLVSASLSHAWLLCNKTFSVLEQANFIRSTAIQYCLDHWKAIRIRRTREIYESEMRTDDDDENDDSVIGNIADPHPHFKSETDWLIDLVSAAPVHLARPIFIVCKSIFNDAWNISEPTRQIAGSLLSTEEGIRRCLRKYGWTGPISQYECAKQVYAWLYKYLSH